jgi:hypothetical protein
MDEVARAKLLFIGIVILLVSGCISYGEFDYALNGRETEATVTKTYETRSRRGGTQLNVEYTFNESNGTQRKGSDRVSTSWSVPANGKVAVLYTSGDGSSRLVGNANWVGLILFAVSLVIIVVGVVRLLIEANAEPPPRRRKRTRGWEY